MLTKKDIEFANKINLKLKMTAKENQMPNCNFIMKCILIERHKCLEEDFMEYKKTDMQGWINDDSIDGVDVIYQYFENGIYLKEISYEDLLYSPLDNGEKSCSLNLFTSWFYMNNFDMENIPEIIEFTGINPNRDEILNLIKKHFGSNTKLSYYTIDDEPNELSTGYIFSHSHHFFFCSPDKVLVFEFDLYD